MVKNSPPNTDVRYIGSISGSERDLGGGHGKPTPVFLPGESHGQRSLAATVQGVAKESNRTEATWHACTHIKYILAIK